MDDRSYPGRVVQAYHTPPTGPPSMVGEGFEALAEEITYDIEARLPEGNMPIQNVSPVGNRWPSPVLIHPAPAGQPCVVRRLGPNNIHVFIEELPATVDCSEVTPNA